MKATIEFNLPEEEDRFKIATRSLDYFSALLDLRNLLREYDKYEMVEDVFVDRVRDILYDVLLDDIS